MKKQIKKRGSFASYRDEKDQTLFRCDVESVAKQLATNWGDIPKNIGNTKAFEIHLLAIAYLELANKVRKINKVNNL